jgi:deoxyribodipyrimidine photo-lyase
MMQRGPLTRWCVADQRIRDNWALCLAQVRALKASAPLVVVFTLNPAPSKGTLRHYGFMMRGLKLLETDLAALGIAFRLLVAEDCVKALGEYCAVVDARDVVTDFSPLREPQQWKEKARSKLPDKCGFSVVDAHNVVPCWIASASLELGEFAGEG